LRQTSKRDNNNSNPTNEKVEKTMITDLNQIENLGKELENSFGRVPVTKNRWV